MSINRWIRRIIFIGMIFLATAGIGFAESLGIQEAQPVVEAEQPVVLDNRLQNGLIHLVDANKRRPDQWISGAYLNAEDEVRFLVDAGKSAGEDGVADQGYSLKIENLVANDARWKQPVKVQNGRTYRLFARVWTENIPEDQAGANLSFEGSTHRSAGITGSSGGWLPLEWYVKTGDVRSDEEVTLQFTAGIGGYGAVTIGQAWFDDLRFQEVMTVPAGVPVTDIGSRNGSGEVINGTSTVTGAIGKETDPFPLGEIKYSAPVWLWISLIAAFVLALLWAVRWASGDQAGSTLSGETSTLQQEIKPDQTAGVHVDVWDGLRGMAIWFVVWFHYWQVTWMDIPLTTWLGPAGFIGVELFFFISGCCLMYPYARYRWENKPKPEHKHFFYRRAIKILPSYYLSLALFIFLLEPQFWARDDAFSNLLMHLFFVQNFEPFAAQAINGVYWSLAVEVQFYVLFPWIALAMIRQPILVGTALAGGAIWYRWYAEQHAIDLTAIGQFHLFSSWMHQLPAVLDLFALGMLTALAITAVRSRKTALQWMNSKQAKWLASAVSLLGMVALLGLIKWLFDNRYDGQELWQAHYRWLIGLVLAVISLGGAFAYRSWQKAVANPVLVFLSLISYNLYIWHQYFARKFADWIEPVTADKHQDPDWQLWVWLSAVAVSLAVTSLITWGFERPLLKYGVKGTLQKLRLLK